jgi:hypothetical protein
MKVRTMETGIMDTAHLRRAREQVAAARVDVLEAKDVFEATKAEAEARAIASLNGNAGKNEEERKRNLTIALNKDNYYRKALLRLREAEATLIDADAELEIAQDQRRAEEWGVRLALITALERAAVPSDAPGDDVIFEDAAVEVGNRALERAARDRARRELEECYP